jgi:hypothetical protein
VTDVCMLRFYCTVCIFCCIIISYGC